MAVALGGPALPVAVFLLTDGQLPIIESHPDCADRVTSIPFTGGVDAIEADCTAPLHSAPKPESKTFRFAEALIPHDAGRFQR